MTAEALREIAVLVLVFAPLDLLFAGVDTPLTRWGMAAILTLAVALFAAGVAVERYRA
jgi:hypothetical protein